MIVNSLLIRRGLPVALVMAATILMQPSTASAGGGYFSLPIGTHYPYYGHHHGHHSYRGRPYYRPVYRSYYRPAYRPVYRPVHRPVYRPVWVRPVGFYVGYAPLVMYAETTALASRARTGALALKVSPKQTEVYVDGSYVGITGKYDGYPGYLWLQEGTHTLTFVAEGYRTFSERFVVRGGTLTNVRFEMEIGEVNPPQPAVAPPVENSSATAPTAASPSAPSTPSVEVREGGTVRFLVEPASASVYLNGRFLGTGSDLARMHGGLLVDVGSHVLEVVHPRHQSDRTSFRIDRGEEIEVRIDLTAGVDEE